MNSKSKFQLGISAIMSLTLVVLIGCTTSNPPLDTTKKTTGTLTVSTLTSSAGGQYAPRNVVAIWVETNSGQYVKTLLAYAAERKFDLTKWYANSSGNTTDAITGATQLKHTTRTCTWNGKDASGNVVANGYYKLCMELSDKNGSGNFSSFAFAKDTIATTLTPTNVSSFSNISIKWIPN
ncbi:MAG: DUF2271 domain-containing protein [Paludibacter sp.]|nr:DUF2271 domain-containing protein [Paludibacter sp.]